MRALRELQRGFMQAVLNGDAAAQRITAHIIAPHGLAPELALRVYENHAQSHFVDSLQSSYPATRRLVGADYFRQCARSFHARHPSQSGDLQFAGADFAPYLAQLHAAGEHRYLGEVARLEWLIQETLLAADHEALDLGKLGRVPAADYDDLRFCLHPSARLFTSQFPCVRIWEANVGSEAQPEPIDLDGGCDRVLLVRDRGCLQFHRLSPGELVFLQSLQAGERFCEACAAPAGFDAAAALRRFVSARAIVDF